MANKLSIKLEGAPGLLNKIKLAVPRIRQNVREEVATTALLIESSAKELSPVDTGLNRASIHAEFSNDGLGAEVVAPTEYAIFLEVGTRYMTARPFMGPAFELHRGRFLERMKQALKVF